MMMNDPYLAEREMKLNTAEALVGAELSRLRRLAKGHGEPSDKEDKQTWWASVVSTVTGNRRGFANLDALFDFLRR
jgi:hypothetical protein